MAFQPSRGLRAATNPPARDRRPCTPPPPAPRHAAPQHCSLSQVAALRAEVLATDWYAELRSSVLELAYIRVGYHGAFQLVTEGIGFNPVALLTFG